MEATTDIYMKAQQNIFSKEGGQRELRKPPRGWAGHHTDYPRQKTVAQLFEEAVLVRPNDIAVIFGATHLSYGELNSRANCLAHRLRQMGVGCETLVGVCLERSLELIVALVGILKAGAAYVPFDPSYPLERLDFMLADTGTPVMVTQKSLLPIAQAGRRVDAILLDEDFAPRSTHEQQNPSPRGSPNSLAYVMYTSGSTGTPKGVLVENRSIVRLLFHTNFCRLGPEEVILQFAPMSFDASTFEVWGALLHGGKLVVMPPRASSLLELGCAIREHQVTTLWLTAGLFNLFVDERLEDLRPVKQLLTGGEALSGPHVRRVLESLPDVALINGYGPTEGTTFTCCHVMRHGDLVPDSVPIGRPISNTFAYILDNDLRPVAVGVPGELCAAGDGVARGYLNAPEITAEKFLADPIANEPGTRMYRTGDLARWGDDGCIEFLGRLDNQVKILGHRIEPGEIEAIVGQFANIRQSCVVAHSDEAGTKRLVAYYVVVDGRKVEPQELKKFLSAKLPAYMVPSLYVSLAALPLNPNGKVDRTALQVRAVVFATNETSTESSSSQVNDKIAEVWKGVLQLDRVGQDDNFFDLGGDSLLLVAVHSQLQKLLQIEIQVTDLFEFTTIRTLAKHLSGAVPVPVSFSAVQQQGQNQRQAFAKRRIQKACKT